MKKAGVFIVIAVILGLSFIGTARILSDTAIAIKNKGYISVKGFAKTKIVSDLGIFEARITEQDIDLKTAYGKLAKGKQAISSFLKKYDFTDKEIEFFPADIHEKYKVNERGYDTDEFIEFRLKQKFRIKSNDVQKIAKLSAEAVDVMSQGVKLTIFNPEYHYTKLEDLKIEMIGKATSNAKERAEKMAKEGKFRLGPIASARVGIFQITPLHSTAISDYGINDTSSIDKEIKSVVDIKYFVK